MSNKTNDIFEENLKELEDETIDLLDAKDRSEGEFNMYDDGSEESKKAERNILEEEDNNYFKN